MVKSNRPVARDNSGSPVGFSADRRLALLLAAVTLGLLLRDVVTGLLPGDAGEFHFAAWNWGLAHPTGYPLYLLLGGVWQRLWSLVGLSPALALNALSAVCLAAAAGLFYLLLRRWLALVINGPPLAAQLAAALGVAFLVANPTLRTQSIQAEVYTPHLLLLVAILLAAAQVAEGQDDHKLHRAGGEESPHPLTRSPAHPLILLALLIGLSLAHHATTVLLLPPLLVYLTLANRQWWRPLRVSLGAGAALLLPLLLYLYVPLRSGPDASPWYHQPLGDGVLTLYAGGWQAFVDFVSGRAISVGYYTVGEAWANLPLAGLLWLRHFEWPGLLLLALGLAALVRARQWPLLALTLGYVLLHQLFNLFYAIGDIFVYYIPLYAIACAWIAFGAAGAATAFRRPAPSAAQTPSPAPAPWLLLLLFWLPVGLWLQYSPLMPQLQAESDAARARWEDILAAAPPPGALLVSNDRNEIVPLFYLQTIEGRGQGLTGLFPLIAPDARFADLGATVQTALDAAGSATGSAAGEAPGVYLIKPMAGLEARFALQPAAPPLVQVLGPAAATPPAVPVDAAYGPLRLLGYDVAPALAAGTGALTEPVTVTLTLHWQVSEPLAGDYTTTVQVFDAGGSKLAQDDRRAGGDYYPTSLWPPGVTLLDRHPLALPAGALPARLLVGMYGGPDATLIAPAVEVEIQKRPKG